MSGPCGEISGCHQYSPGLSGPDGFPVGEPLVWKDGWGIANDVASRAIERATAAKILIRYERRTGSELE